MIRLLTAMLIVWGLIGCDGGNKNFTAEEETETRLRALKIIDAIESYSSDTGFYPVSLEDLTPKYISIPIKTVKNTDFQYEVFKEIDGYRLFINEAPCEYINHPVYFKPWNCSMF